MKKENTLIVTLAVVVAIAAVTWGLLAAPASISEVNMPRGVTPFSEQVYDLHMLILWICIIIGVLVFTAMFTAIVLHRKSRGVEPAKFSHSTTAEIIWTVIPVIILAAMAFPAIKTLITMEDTGAADMTIKITGYQWKWKYEYLEEGIEFLSSLSPESNAARQLDSGIDPGSVENYLLDVDKPLVVPANTKIKFLITSDDVIHAWWVPELGWKRDAIPGFINEAWTLIQEPGTYRGQCAELCGKDHGFMPVVVIAKPKPEYQAWIDQQQRSIAHQQTETQRLWSRQELMAHGEEIYQRQCATCHQADGSGLAPAFPPLAGSRIATGPLNEHIDLVLNGRDGTAMQAWSELLNEADIAAALTYTRNAWGNDTGDLVQPRAIAKINKG